MGTYSCSDEKRLSLDSPDGTTCFWEDGGYSGTCSLSGHAVGEMCWCGQGFLRKGKTLLVVENDNLNSEEYTILYWKNIYNRSQRKRTRKGWYSNRISPLLRRYKRSGTSERKESTWCLGSFGDPTSMLLTVVGESCLDACTEKRLT